mgnify:CR=1 FL=1
MTKRFGFTLAEVLITLGIIGVVAAMTIPTLIANTNSAKFRSQFKKTLSTMNQAALMGQAQYDMNYADATKTCGTAETGVTADAETADSHPTICAILNDVLSGANYVAKVADLTNSKGSYKVTPATTTSGLTNVGFTAGTESAPGDTIIGYTLADGSLFAFPNTAKDCTKSAPCYAFIDVNGATLPNKEVSCKGGAADKDTTASLIQPAYAEDDPETPAATTADTCTVPNDAAHMTDVFPVLFYDSTVEPATNAARYVLTTSK